MSRGVYVNCYVKDSMLHVLEGTEDTESAGEKFVLPRRSDPSAKHRATSSIDSAIHLNTERLFRVFQELK